MCASGEAAYERLGDLGLEAEPLECPEAPFPIWLIKVRGAPPMTAWALLSGSEQQRAMRFAAVHLRGRYVAAHAAIRILIEAYFGIAVDRQCFVRTAFGKPQLRGYPEVQYSLSYSEGRVLIGIAPEAEIGVDIERMRMIEDAVDLMALHFTPREQAALHVNEPGTIAFHRLFLTLWSRKEACLKALGRGLSFSPAGVECGTEKRVAPVRIGRRQVRMGAIQMGGDYVASWAAATPIPSPP